MVFLIFGLLVGVDKENSPLDWSARLKIALGLLMNWLICMKIQVPMSYIGTSSQAISCWKMLLHQKYPILDWPEQQLMKGTNTYQQSDGNFWGNSYFLLSCVYFGKFYLQVISLHRYPLCFCNHSNIINL